MSTSDSKQNIAVRVKQCLTIVTQLPSVLEPYYLISCHALETTYQSIGLK